MKRIVACVLMLSVIGAVPALAGDTPWFDFENCSMCKPVMAIPGLMDHMSWEVHELSNGMLQIGTVDPAFSAQFATACQGMDEVKAKLMAGEQLPLCGMCQSVGALMMEGATMEEVMTKNGYAAVMTSSDAKVVAKIHDHVKHTNEEMAKMMGESGAHGDHGSH